VTAKLLDACDGHAESALEGPANGADSRLRAAFEDVKRVYPLERIGDERDAYRAFVAAVRQRGMTMVVKLITDLRLEHDTDVPWLADALAVIECDQARRRSWQ